MLSLYRPGTGLFYRISAGSKVLLLALAVTGLSLLPSTWQAAGIAALSVFVGFIVAGLPNVSWGVRAGVRMLVDLKWLLLIILIGQLLFTPLEAAIASTVRIVAAVALAGLLTLTTKTADLLSFTEWALTPLRWVRIDPARVALMLSVALSAIPALMNSATQVREAQRARGSRGNLGHFTLAFLIVSLKHADEVGEALAARGAE